LYPRRRCLTKEKGGGYDGAMQIEKGIDKLVKTVRIMILDKPGFFGKVATAIGAAGGISATSSSSGTG